MFSFFLLVMTSPFIIIDIQLAEKKPTNPHYSEKYRQIRGTQELSKIELGQVIKHTRQDVKRRIKEYNEKAKLHGA